MDPGGEGSQGPTLLTMPRGPVSTPEKKRKAKTQCDWTPPKLKRARQENQAADVKETKIEAVRITKKRPEVAVTQATPQKKTRHPASGEKPSEKGKQEKVEVKTPKQQDSQPGPELNEEWQMVMSKLFQGIETVLQLRASRERITSLEMLQQNVVASTQKDLTIERLQQVLTLSGGMLEAVWIGEDGGLNTYLSIEQRENGKVCRPQGASISDRRSRFMTALAKAREKRELVVKPLPERPVKESKISVPQVAEVDYEAGRAAAAKLAELAKLPSLKRTGSCHERMEALKARIAAKRSIVEKEEHEKAEFQRILDAISLCEDVLAAREVLIHLFARPGEGKLVNISEKKILGALCSCSYAEQCTRSVSLEAGRLALTKLKELGEGLWFTVIPAQYSEETFWRRMPGGNDEGVRAALNSQLRKLQEEKRKIISLGNVKASKIEKDKS